jgi:hypothetical protein
MEVLADDGREQVSEWLEVIQLREERFNVTLSNKRLNISIVDSAPKALINSSSRTQTLKGSLLVMEV